MCAPGKGKDDRTQPVEEDLRSRAPLNSAKELRIGADLDAQGCAEGLSVGSVKVSVKSADNISFAGDGV